MLPRCIEHSLSLSPLHRFARAPLRWWLHHTQSVATKRHPRCLIFHQLQLGGLRRNNNVTTVRRFDGRAVRPYGGRASPSQCYLCYQRYNGGSATLNPTFDFARSLVQTGPTASGIQTSGREIALGCQASLGRYASV